MFRGSYTAGSVAFFLLSTTLPAFCFAFLRADCIFLCKKAAVQPLYSSFLLYVLFFHMAICQMVHDSGRCRAERKPQHDAAQDIGGEVHIEV